MIESKVVKITPAYARELLSNNTMNRPLKRNHVDQLAAAMGRGEWQMNGESIKLSKCGKLLDGQHRLSAIVKTGAACEILVISGLPLESFHTINTGAILRGAGDILAINGEKNFNVLASGARLLKCWEHNKENPLFQGNKVSVPEIEDVISRHPNLRKFSAYKIDSLKRMISPSIVCFLGYIFHMVNPIKAAQFFEQLSTGLGLQKGSPVLLLRDRLLMNAQGSPKMPREHVCALTIKAFNAFCDNKNIGNLRYSSSEKFPLITGV